MDTFARSFAFAWRNEEILITAVIAEAEFACSCDLFFGLVHSIEFSKEKLFFLFLTFLGNSSYLYHSVFNSTQFDDISRIWIDRKILRLYPSVRLLLLKSLTIKYALVFIGPA